MVNGLKKNGYEHSTPNVGKPGLTGVDGGVFILSKHPILYYEGETFNKTCVGTDCLSDKGVMYAKIQIKNEKYHIFGTHLQAHDGNHNIRVQQLRIIRKFIDKFNIPKNEMIIIGGDTNIEKYNEKEYNDQLNILNAKSPRYLGLRYTIDGRINRLANTQGGDKVEFLDYVLYDKNHKLPNEEKSFINALTYKSDLPWKEFFWEPDYWDLSDHFPVYAQFEF
jgi:phospholipase C